MAREHITFSDADAGRLAMAIIAHMLGARYSYDRYVSGLSRNARGTDVSRFLTELHRVNDLAIVQQWKPWVAGSTVPLGLPKKRRKALQSAVGVRGLTVPQALTYGLVEASTLAIVTDDIVGDTDAFCDEPMTDVYGRNRIPRNPYMGTSCTLEGRALAAALYLLRGYASFFSRLRGGRTYNAGRISLNDVFQGYQIARGLYQQLADDEAQIGQHGLGEYYACVRACALRVAEEGDAPSLREALPLFVWSAFTVGDMQRANVYRQLGMDAKASKHYRWARARIRAVYDPVTTETDTRYAYVFGGRSTALASFERGKLLFDMGEFLHCLQLYVETVVLLVVEDQVSTNAANDVADAWTKAARRLIAVLDRERRAPSFVRLQIQAMFGDPSESYDEIRFDVTALSMCIQRASSRSIVVDVLARIGFTLLTIRQRCVMDEDVVQWLESYLRADLIGFTDVGPSDFGLYTQMRLRPGAASGVNDLFSSYIDRAFVSILRSRLALTDSDGSAGLSDMGLRRALFNAATLNVENIVTEPRRNRRLLMRGGRLARASEHGAPTNVFEAAQAAMELTVPEPAQPSDGRLVVLRRWQSFNPKMPHYGQWDVRGGGYLLLWNGCGWAVDPGFDFLANLYDEGFSLQDIDAVVVTHAHPDHDDELTSLTTLLREWNEFHDRSGESSMGKRLDFYLNQGAFVKFHSWLESSRSSKDVGRIVCLPAAPWDESRGSSMDGAPIRNLVELDLRIVRPYHRPGMAERPFYNLTLTVVPGWHRDVIGRSNAVGLVFSLYNKDELAITVGYTGDTGAYGVRPWTSVREGTSVATLYSKCDVLIGHLGDIRLRELRTLLWPQWMAIEDPGAVTPGADLLKAWLFVDVESPGALRVRLREWLYFTSYLDLIDGRLLEAPISTLLDRAGAKRLRADVPLASTSVQQWLGGYIQGIYDVGGGYGKYDVSVGKLRTFLERKGEELRVEGMSDEDARAVVDVALRTYQNLVGEVVLSLTRPVDMLAAKVASALTAASEMPWQYGGHLGLLGIQALHSGMCKQAQSRTARKSRLFVVGELPEELASYRNQVARYLDETQVARETGVTCITADIGLSIRLPSNPHGAVKIRCAYCEHNNEIAMSDHGGYHDPSMIDEVPLKRRGGAMGYFCRSRQHAPHPWKAPISFFQAPETNVFRD